MLWSGAVLCEGINSSERFTPPQRVSKLRLIHFLSGQCLYSFRISALWGKVSSEILHVEQARIFLCHSKAEAQSLQFPIKSQGKSKLASYTSCFFPRFLLSFLFRFCGFLLCANLRARLNGTIYVSSIFQYFNCFNKEDQGHPGI